MRSNGGLSLSLPLKMHYLETFRRIDSLLLRRTHIFKETGAEDGSFVGPLRSLAEAGFQEIIHF